MYLQDHVVLSYVIMPLGSLANTSFAMQLEESKLCMVTKIALLQQQNQHMQEKLETQTQQLLHPSDWTPCKKGVCSQQY